MPGELNPDHAGNLFSPLALCLAIGNLGHCYTSTYFHLCDSDSVSSENCLCMCTPVMPYRPGFSL